MNCEQIVSIEEVGDGFVYDIQVTGNNLFFANDILTHNSAIDAEKLTQAHIQGGISKINTSDYTVAIKQDDLMRAAGEIYLEILKSRNSAGVGKRLLLGWDPVSLGIFSFEKKNNELPLVKRGSQKVLSTTDTIFNQKGNDDILNLMNT
jgi:hypothetical protein